jgi:hypothetical protein
MKYFSGYMLAMLVLGVALFVVSENIDKLAQQCNSNSLRRANRGLLAISVIIIVGVLSWANCKSSCAEGTLTGILTRGLGDKVFAVFFLLLGLVLMSLASTIVAECKMAGSSGAGLAVGTGVAMAVVSGAYLAYDLFFKHKYPLESLMGKLGSVPSAPAVALGSDVYGYDCY